MLPVCPRAGRLGLVSLLILPLLMNVGPAEAEVRLPAVIGENMVLQQQMEVPIWGWANPGEWIRVSADWLPERVTAVTDDDGRWQVRLKTPAAGGPHTIAITGTNAITLSNVMIGEVWICSGQSNMEWPLTRTLNGEAEIAAANYPGVRLFNMKNAIAASPKSDCDGQWTVCDPQTVGTFSAVAYFFGRELHRELNLPIGLIATDWGGTVAEAWTSAEALRSMGDFDAALDGLEQERANAGYLKQAHEQALEHWWVEVAKVDPGSKEEWMSPSCDDSPWKPMQVPAAWQSDDLKDFDGIVWFRTHVDLPAESANTDLVLELGPIDDIDTTWFNGKKVGGLEGLNRWHVPRRYRVPKGSARAGANTIAVRVLDMGRRGGICGKPEQLRLRTVSQGNEEAQPLAGQWRYRVGPELEDLPPWPRTYMFHADSPTVLYNAMIAPLVPYAIRGAIWYQGEANRPRARQYRSLFPLLIGDWRARWGQGDFPFYYVQIAPFGYARDTGQTAELREAQLLSLATSNTGIVVTMDIGDPRDIHPKNKQDVGRRLSLWALAKTYGKADLVYSGPLYESMSGEGNRIRIRFEHAGSGLAARDGQPLSWFEIAGKERKFVQAKAEIDGDTVIVWSDAVPEPVAVRYGWHATAEPNLMNKEGLPASPFRTHDWTEAAVEPQGAS